MALLVIAPEPGKWFERWPLRNVFGASPGSKSQNTSAAVCGRVCKRLGVSESAEKSASSTSSASTANPLRSGSDDAKWTISNASWFANAREITRRWFVSCASGAPPASRSNTTLIGADDGAAFSSAPGPDGASTARLSPATARSATRNAAVAARRRA